MDQVAKAERKAHREELKRKFPGAVLVGSNVSLIVNEGAPHLSIDLRKFGDWSTHNPDYEWTYIKCSLSDWAELIAALVCRYNAAVDDLNSATSTVKTAKLVPMPPVEP